MKHSHVLLVVDKSIYLVFVWNVIFKRVCIVLNAVLAWQEIGGVLYFMFMFLFLCVEFSQTGTLFQECCFCNVKNCNKRLKN